MSPKQKKLAAKAPPPNKIDEKDFKVLREEKAKGRGMGLQDEKVQPGKVMKAKKGHFSKSNVSGHKRVMGVFPTIDKVPPTAKGKDLLKKNTTPLKALGKVATSRAGALGAILGAGAVGLNVAGRKLKKVLDERKARKRDEAKVKKMGGGMMNKYNKGGGADTGKQGEMKSKIAVGTMRVNKILERLKTKDRLTQRDIEAGKELLNQKKFTKRMGGGMIAPSQRPGYSKGTMVKARGCKLGRTRPTKIT